MGRVTQTESGAVATFRSPGKVPINSLKAYFAPVQEGEGTPSLDNVRPITGWTGVNIYHTRKNILNPNAERTKGNFTADGNIASAGNTYVFGITVKPGTYVLKNKGTGVSYRVGLTKLYPKQGVYVNYLATRSGSADPYVITVASGWNYIALATTASVENVALTMIEPGSTASEYEPYVGESFPVSWESSGSLYGGYVDLVTGEVWKTWDSDILDGSKTIKAASSNRWQIVYPGGTFHYVRTSSAYIKSDKLSPIAASSTGGTKKYIIAIGGAGYLFLQLDSDVYTTVEEVEAWLEENKPQIVYEKATPQLVTTLTPTQLRSLIGSNSIWSDAGDVEVNYDYAEPVEMLRIRERAAWGGV